MKHVALQWVVPLHKPTNRIYTDGSAIIEWLIPTLDKLGMKLKPIPFLKEKVFEKLESLPALPITQAAPSMVPSQVSFVPTSDLTIQLEDQKITFTGIGEDGTFQKMDECKSLVERGGQIVKMKVLVNLEDNNYMLHLSTSSPNTFKVDPGNVKGNVYDRLFYRFERVVALNYILENVLLPAL